LFLVLLVIDFIDVVFAIDSVPAIVGLSDEPFVIVTSNIFAILGLRALYFLLAGTMDMFRYLRFGLSAILIFVGVKMLASHWIAVPPLIALAVVLSFLAIAIVASIIASRWPSPPHARKSAEDLFAGEPPNGDSPLVDGDGQPSVASEPASAPRE
jgi:tellurite resistance protein TerC